MSEDNIRLHNLDCMDFMRGVPDKAYELAIVDPPYRDQNDPTIDMRNSGSMESIIGRPSVEYFDELRRVSKEQIIWGANNFQLPQFKGFIVWDKAMPFDFTMSMAEIASISEGLGTISKIFKLRITQHSTRIHPTQKPVALYKWLLNNYAKKGDKILDTHGGSMSIAIACYDLGFDLDLCELYKDYFAAGKQRLDDHIAKYAPAGDRPVTNRGELKLF